MPIRTILAVAALSLTLVGCRAAGGSSSGASVTPTEQSADTGAVVAEAISSSSSSENVIDGSFPEDGLMVEQVQRSSVSSRAVSGTTTYVTHTVTTGTSATSATALPGVVTLTLLPDRTEAQPGDSVRVGIAVENRTGSDLKNAQVESFYPSDLVVLTDNGGASVSGNRLRWTIDNLPAGRTRTLSYGVRTSTNLLHNTLLNFPVSLYGGNLGNSVSGVEYVRILTYFPQTGVSLRSAMIIAGVCGIALIAGGCATGMAVARAMIRA